MSHSPTPSSVLRAFLKVNFLQPVRASYHISMYPLFSWTPEVRGYMLLQMFTLSKQESLKNHRDIYHLKITYACSFNSFIYKRRLLGYGASNIPSHNNIIVFHPFRLMKTLTKSLLYFLLHSSRYTKDSLKHAYHLPMWGYSSRKLCKCIIANVYLLFLFIINLKETLQMQK